MYFHRTLVNKHPVQLGESLIGGIGLVENDSGDTTTSAIGSIGD